MCGRYTLASSAATISEEFGVVLDGPFAPRYNIAPSQPILIVRADATGREATWVEWGLLPAWSRDPRAARRPINARAETVAEKPSFRAAYKRRRCLVPADGYYEWVAGAGGKQPYYIHRDDGGCFAIAGLWEHWERDGSAIESCALLTCAANRSLSTIHDRMPVIITPSAYSSWLDEHTSASTLAQLLGPAADDALIAHAVSKRVNSPANDSLECIEPDAGPR